MREWLTCTGDAYSIGALSQAVAQLLVSIAMKEPVRLVAYSMGARIALQMLLTASPGISGALLISATAGIEDQAERQARAANDDKLAERLLRVGLNKFTSDWYKSALWTDFAAHPR